MPLLLLLGCDTQPAPTPAAVKPADLRLVRSVMRQVQDSYVEPIDSSTLVANALKGMLGQLDPHSEYLDEQEYQEMESDSRGVIVGVGLDIEPVDGAPRVVAAIAGGPAARAGIRQGDRLVKLDDQPMLDLSSEQLVQRLRGPAGSTVRLTVARGGQPDFTVTLVRSLVHFPSVTSAIEANGIGYVRISEFTENTPAELSDAVARLKQSGALRGLVLDLRDDPGGLVDAAVAVAADFLDGGTVVTTHGRDRDDDDVYRAPDNGDVIPGVPLAVLINGHSASAAEIVAGALQDRHRATLLGTRSFGKGSVQTLFPLDGHGALRLTTGFYFTPSARSIQGSGITPDIVVPLPPGERDTGAAPEHEADLPRALPAPWSDAATPAGAAAGPRSADRAAEASIDLTLIGTAADDQLQAALKFLQSRNMLRAAAAR